MTTLQELIEFLNQTKTLSNLNELQIISLDNKLTELLQKEKQQIIEAYNIGVAEKIQFKTGQTYYKETYEK